MSYKIAVCDDSSADTSYVKSMVTEWSKINNIPVNIETFNSAEAFLFSYADKSDWDILLLDIEMGEMNGVSMAKKVRSGNKYVQIVFITGYSDYIAEGYDVAALHYLMKPVHKEKLFEVLDRAVNVLRKNDRELKIEIGGETVRVPLYEIKYIDVIKNYVTVHADEEYTVKKTLGEFSDKLDDSFFRIGRSCIVNLKYIRKITKTDVHLTDGSVIPLPRGQYEPLNRAIIALD